MTDGSAAPQRIALLYGGPSSEHDVSVKSAASAGAALRAAGFDVHPVFVDRDGGWHLSPPTADINLAAPSPPAECLRLEQALTSLRALDPVCCFLGFHGTFGEDGRVQAALELAGLRYTGSGPLASGLAMDKVMARRIFRSVGLPVAPALELDSAVLQAPGGLEAAAACVVEAVGVPCVGKVAAGGSSVGVEIVRRREDLEATLLRLGAMWPTVLVERFIAGTELTCGVLRIQGEEVALPPVEIAPKPGRFFDYEVKYDPSLVEEICPARVSASATAELQRLAVAAHHALGFRGVSRTDAILDADGAIWLLETNTLPGLTPASLLPKAAAGAGMAYSDLLRHILAAAGVEVSAPSP